MKVVVNDKEKLLSQHGYDRAVSRANAAFARFSDCITTVNITVRDVNGPRGGFDKECSVVISVKRQNNIAVKSVHKSITMSVQAAIDRAERTLGRNLDRKAFRMRSGFGSTQLA